MNALNPPRHLGTTGALSYIGLSQLGSSTEYRYYRCGSCGTDYPVIDGVIRCNGFAITDCPWCGTHSKRAAEVRR